MVNFVDESLIVACILFALSFEKIKLERRKCAKALKNLLNVYVFLILLVRVLINIELLEIYATGSIFLGWGTFRRLVDWFLQDHRLVCHWRFGLRPRSHRNLIKTER